MKKQKEQQQVYEIDDFQNHCNLWNIVSGGDSSGILMLRTLVDSIQATSYARPGSKMPSILIVGKEGKQLATKALINSLAIADARFCHGSYLDYGYGSCQLFDGSLINTAHIITNIEYLSRTGEAVIWRYLNNGRCNHYNFDTRKYDIVLHCNGLIILTAEDIDSAPVPETIVKAVDHIITLQDYTTAQLEIVVHQQLKFCGIEYESEQVTKEIVGKSPQGISQVMQFLKVCVMVLRAEMAVCLTVEIVEKAKKLTG